MVRVKVPMCQPRRGYASDGRGDVLYFMGLGAMSEPTADPAVLFSVCCDHTSGAQAAPTIYSVTDRRLLSPAQRWSFTQFHL